MRVKSAMPCCALADVIVHRSLAQTGGEGGKPVSPTEEKPILDMHVAKLSAGQAMRTFGEQSIARWRGTTDSNANVLENDLIEISTGTYAGTTLQVKGTRVPGGMLMIVELADTDRVSS